MSDDPAAPGGAGVPAEPPVPAADAAVVDADGTWTEPGTEVAALPSVVEARAQRRHENKMQRWLLTGIGGLLVFMVAVLVGGLAAHWISEDFAKTLAQMTIPVLLTFGGAIVGSLFHTGGNDTGD